MTRKQPDSNPKTQFGIMKPDIWHVPVTAIYMASLAHTHGALKYGHFNWRKDPISASTYLNATLRHINQYIEGEDVASDSGIPHLASAVAGLNILMDAKICNTLIDDRSQPALVLESLFEELEPMLKRIHKDWGPKEDTTKGKDND